ncbi:MAG: hypothetical protein KDI07_10985 [Anaerolineae bacterium]|nr:hypothetical protein [Anaerolineae bacterium]HRX03748.1 hypothetical protein [Anaerolineae bacterium]
MIDWYGVFHNALWVAGLAIALASLSYMDWRRRTQEPRIGFRVALGQPGFQTVFSLGMVLFCVGVALGGASWWQTAGWAILAVAFGWLAFTSWRKLRHPHADDAEQDDPGDESDLS